MKIAILCIRCAGCVGASVAERLVCEDNDITIVDSDQERVHYRPDMSNDLKLVRLWQ